LERSSAFASVRLTQTNFTRRINRFFKQAASNINELNMVAPTGFDRLTSWLEVEFEGVGLAA
jgi:hypothetical protein